MALYGPLDQEKRSAIHNHNRIRWPIPLIGGLRPAAQNKLAYMQRKNLDKQFLSIMFLGVFVLSIFMITQASSQKKITTTKSSNANASNTATIDTSDWKTYQDEELGIEFKYESNSDVTITSITLPKKCPPETVCGAQPLNPHIVVEIGRNPNPNQPARYYSFTLGRRETPTIKDVSPHTRVDAFPGPSISVRKSLDEISKQLNEVFLDTAYPKFTKIGDKDAIQFYALQDDFGYYTEELMLIPLAGKKYSHILITLYSDYGGEQCSGGSHAEFIQCIANSRVGKLDPDRKDIINTVNTFKEITS